MHRIETADFSFLVARDALDLLRAHGLTDAPTAFDDPAGRLIFQTRQLEARRLTLRNRPPSRELLWIRARRGLRVVTPFGDPADEAGFRWDDAAFGSVSVSDVGFPGRPVFVLKRTAAGREAVVFAIELSEGASSVSECLAADDVDRVREAFVRDLCSAGPDAIESAAAPALWFRASDADPFRPAVRLASPVSRAHQAAAFDMALAGIGIGWRGRSRVLLRTRTIPDARDFEAAWADPELRREVALSDRVAFDVKTDSRGVFEVAHEEAELLAKEGIDGAAEGLAYRGGVSLRKLHDRENVRIDATGFRSGERRYFMKRFPARSGLKLLSGRARTRARDEWENACLVRSTGWGTAAPGAIGEERPVGRGASFVAMREIAGARPLDDVLADLANGAADSPAARKEVRSVVVTLAGLVAALHRAGAYHKDLYLCHVLVRGSGSRREWFLIDLDRMRWGRRVRLRWFVKDLAALHHSADGAIVSRTDRLRFVRRYLRRHPRLGDERRLIGRILRKAARMGSHVPRHR